MKLFDSLISHRALLLERPSWDVACTLRRRESFGSVSSQTKFRLSADSEDDARDAVRAYVQQCHPGAVIESVRVTRHSQMRPEMA